MFTSYSSESVNVLFYIIEGEIMVANQLMLRYEDYPGLPG